MGLYLPFLAPQNVLAQEPSPLKLTRELGATWLTHTAARERPIFLSAEHVQGDPDGQTQLHGNAQLRQADTLIRARNMRYNQQSDTASASEEVYVNRNGDRYWGDYLELQVEESKGFFSKPHYKFLKNNAGGQASRIDFLDAYRSIAHNVSYSSCRAPEYGEDGKPWKPDWILKADAIEFDTQEDAAVATGAVLRFKEVPILRLPGFSFPLSGRRKSGFLPPTVATDSLNGTEVIQPYYLNLAPNYDMTLFPVVSTRRGVGLGTQWRYLTPHVEGSTQWDLLPNDRVSHTNRWGLHSEQRGRLGNHTAWRVLFNRVSDDGYWKDFLNLNAALTQRLLLNEASLSGTYAGWNSLLRLQRWQTLQDSLTPITPPFDRYPQLLTRKQFLLPYGLQGELEGDYSAFSSQSALTGQPNAQRIVGSAYLSLPMLAPYGYLTPKLSLYARSYRLESPYAAGGSTNLDQQRFNPIFSLDSGLVFERPVGEPQREHIQTLEPRAYFVRSPYREQDTLPNYDSAARDFSMSSIFSDNRYVGSDRIADASLLTLGLTTRFINTDNGAELARASVAQRHSFEDSRVRLPGESVTNPRISDWLLSTTLSPSPLWALDSTVQFAQASNVSERTTLTGRYNPAAYRNLYLAYRMQRKVSEQIDVGWQWPVGDFWKAFNRNGAAASEQQENRWFSVGRVNYSMRDARMVNALLGFEYDATCWIGRLVLEQTQLDVNTSNTRVMFQIEFSGFVRVGINPLARLRSNIPRYQNLRERVDTPDRFTHYD